MIQVLIGLRLGALAAIAAAALAAAPARAGDLKIAFLTPLTGPSSATGVDGEEGA